MHHKTETNDLKKIISEMNIPNLHLPNHKDEGWRFTNLDFLKNINDNNNANSQLSIFYKNFI